MIEKIRIRGYRKFRDLVVIPAASVNMLVGDNETDVPHFSPTI